MLAAKDVPWDEERDSIWHEGYDVWISRSSETTTQPAQLFFYKELSVGPYNQRMLAGVLKVLSSLPAANNGKAIETRRKSSAPELDELSVTRLAVVEKVRKQGQEWMESEHYVYRALFWAMLFRCTAPVSRWHLRFVYVLTVGRLRGSAREGITPPSSKAPPPRKRYTNSASSFS